MVEGFLGICNGEWADPPPSYVPVTFKEVDRAEDLGHDPVRARTDGRHRGGRA